MHPAGERHAALFRPQALARQVHRDERRRAGRVDRYARALQAQHVREAAGRDAVSGPGCLVRVDLLDVAVLELQRGVIRGADPDEHAGCAARESVRGLPGVLERFPAHLEQQALLRIHAGGLAGRDAEEWRVEPVDTAQEPGPPRVHLAGRLGIRIVERVEVPPFARRLADRVAALDEQLPERLGCIGIAREPAADADHGDGRVDRLLGRGELRLRLLEREKRAFERRQLGHGFLRLLAH